LVALFGSHANHVLCCCHTLGPSWQVIVWNAQASSACPITAVIKGRSQKARSLLLYSCSITIKTTPTEQEQQQSSQLVQAFLRQN
jgi:hypothetical protein